MTKDNFAADIDPQLALEILPQKITERKKVITSLTLDLQIAQASTFSTGEEIAQLERAIQAQKSFLKLYEERLEAVRKAIAGT